MVFRRDSKVDAFQRQISALRHQLGGETQEIPYPEMNHPRLAPPESSYRTGLPDLDTVRPESSLATVELADFPDRDPSASPLPPVPAADMHTSVIAHTTTWSGNLESSGSLHVHGRVDGSLTARDDIFIAEEAEIDAVITASSVTVAGSVRGSIRCAERFEVLPRGRVVGDVQAPLIVVHEGAMIAGDVAMSKSGESQSSPPHAPAPRTVRSGA